MRSPWCWPCSSPSGASAWPASACWPAGPPPWRASAAPPCSPSTRPAPSPPTAWRCSGCSPGPLASSGKRVLRWRNPGTGCWSWRCWPAAAIRWMRWSWRSRGWRRSSSARASTSTPIGRCSGSTPSAVSCWCSPSSGVMATAAATSPPRGHRRRSPISATWRARHRPPSCRPPMPWLPRGCGCWRWPAGWMGRRSIASCNRSVTPASRRWGCTTSPSSPWVCWGWPIRCARRCPPRSSRRVRPGCGW